jgi:hypothetical protein
MRVRVAVAVVVVVTVAFWARDGVKRVVRVRRRRGRVAILARLALSGNTRTSDEEIQARSCS